MVVRCRNKDKGVQAKNACDVSCIGCKLCVKKCESNAITVEDNVARIDAALCTLCGKCEQACPRKSIQKIGEWDTPQEMPAEENPVTETITTKNKAQ
jgi:ferredoxin